MLALADLRLKQRAAVEAAELATRAMAIARDTASPDLEWRAAHTAGRAARDRGRFDDAVESLRVSATIVNDLRANVTSDTGKIGFLDRRQEVFQDLAAVLFSAKRPAEALEAAEAGRARAFADLLAQRQVEGKPAERQPLTAVRTALNDLRAADRAAPAQTGQGRSDAVRGGALDTSLAALRESSRELSSLLTAESPTRFEIAEIARRVQATLVEYLVTEQATLIWVVTPSGEIHATSVAAGRQRLEKLVEEFRTVTVTAQELSSPVPQRYLTLSRDLDALLIEPIAAWLPTSPEALVVIMPHGPLPVLPFAVLRDRRGRHAGVAPHAGVRACHFGVSLYRCQAADRFRVGAAVGSRHRGPRLPQRSGHAGAGWRPRGRQSGGQAARPGRRAVVGPECVRGRRQAARARPAPAALCHAWCHRGRPPTRVVAPAHGR